MNTLLNDAPALSAQHTAPRLKILLLRIRLLHPLNVGSKIRTAKMVEELAKRHDVTVVAYRFPDETDADAADTAAIVNRLVTVPLTETPKRSPRFYAELARNLFDPRPYMVAKYATDAMAQTVARLYREERPDLIICDFPHACEGLSALGNVPYLLFQHNVEAAIFEQLAGREKNPLARAYLRLQARKMRDYEKTACLRASTVLAVSDVDREAYIRDYGLNDCDVIPTGVDTEFFRPDTGGEEPNSLVFTGSMDWLANQDGITYFAQGIWPLIRAQVPDVRLTIVGRNPPPSIEKLGETPGITVTGTVPDIRPHVYAAQVYIVPLRVGSGTRLKLVEAMGMGKAIVSTSRGAEGLPVEQGRNMVLADTPQEFAREVVSLMRDPARRAALEAGARAAAEERHSWRYVGEIFDGICRRAAEVMARQS